MLVLVRSSHTLIYNVLYMYLGVWIGVRIFDDKTNVPIKIINALP